MNSLLFLGYNLYIPLKIVRNDITRMDVDAIVCPTNRSLIPGDGIDYAVSKKAGRELLKELKRVGYCPKGGAVATEGFALPCRNIIFTVGPQWNNGSSNEEQMLIKAYRSCLDMALELNAASIAFPLIATGYYGFPKDRCLKIANDAITAFLQDHEMLIYLVVYDDKSFRISTSLFNSVREYIDQRYVDEHVPLCSRAARSFARAEGPSLSSMLKNTGETFSDMLLRLIREKKLDEVACYKGANIDRKLFSKIRSNKNYKPSKATVLSFGISLRLAIDELNTLLETAGYALSHSDKRDIIIRYFIENRDYDIFRINETLFSFNEPTLDKR